MENTALHSSSCARCTFLFDPEVPLDPSSISSDILDTNDPPAEVDIPSIHEFIARGSARRTHLDTKIASLKASLDELLQDRDPLDTEIRKHEGAVSPLRRMPTELLSLIFKYTLPPHGHFPRVDSGPWAIAAVCSRWRTIVLSQPTLWSTVVLDFTDDPRPVIETAETLEAHLERSGGSPLDITFITWDEQHCAEHELEVLDILAYHCERWETVTLSGPEALYSRLASIRGCLPLLRELHISAYPHILEDECGPIDIFEFCPRLQEAFINAGPYHKTSPTAPLPFSQLLRFSGSNPLPRHLGALRFASSLVDCILTCTEPMTVLPGSSLTLPHLLRLSVSQTKILDCLETPALQELYCCAQSSHLHSFLRRLRSRLQKLVVPNTPATTDIPVLLHVARTITTLGLSLPIDLTPELFSTFTLATPSDPANALPTLTAISIRVIRDTSDVDYDDDALPHLDQDLLMQMVEAQWQHGTWRSVKLYCPKFKPSPKTFERMELLRGQGMQIVIFTSGILLYDDLVPPDFRLYDDYPSFFEL
ncbi:hypothetical protein FB451DRAFT_1263612 [Mycena latifolia]|nr:hypothetical protein FB451DRAFT_1263612 [Mycena latifolia]